MQPDAAVALGATLLRLRDYTADFQWIEIGPSGKDIEREMAGPPKTVAAAAFPAVRSASWKTALFCGESNRF
jgi:hypothetical protein